MLEMYMSGYSEKERLKTLESAFNTHQKIVKKVNEGKRKYYRRATENKSVSTFKNLKKRSDWYKNRDNNFKAVMFVEASQGDSLLKTFRHIENIHRIRNDIRVKFVSKSGVKLSNILQNKEVSKNCDDKKCIPTRMAIKEGKTIDCKKMNICYQAQCKTCDSRGKRKVYFGETHRNLHIRSIEHYRTCDSEKAKKNWMKKHIEDEH